MINKINEEEKGELKKLWKSAFPNQLGNSIDTYFEVYFDEDETYVLRDKNQNIISSVQVKDKVLNLNNKKLKVSYLTNIQTKHEHQDKGYMKRLITSVLEEKGKEELVTLLRPYEPNLYRSLGFENVIELFEYSILSNTIPNLSTEGIVINPNSNDLVNSYTKFSSHFDGYFDRDEKYYDKLKAFILKQNGNLIAYKKDDELLGYCVYLTHSTDVEILECTYDTSGTLVKLLSFVSRSKSRITLKTSTSENIKRVFPEAKRSKKPFLMARVNNRELFERLYDVKILSALSAFNIGSAPKFNRDFE